jgi:hypothetical protein
LEFRGVRFPSTVQTKLKIMFKVIKEYAGVKVGEIVNVPQNALNHMLEKGYIEPIDENKAIVPDYAKESKRGRKPKK